MFFEFLGFAVILHVIFVSITMGVGLITAIYRYFGIKNKEAEFFARRSFRIIIIFELFSGVWGTIITVILAGFFPNLLALAVNVLFVPILIALISIMVRIPSIGIFWYTWGKVNPAVHSAIGFIMAVSGFMIPFGFRVIFAELNYPFALLNNFAYLNPVFWLLYLHTIFAAISVGGFVIAAIASSERDISGSLIGTRFGFFALFFSFAFGSFYWLSLSFYSPLIYKNITTGIFASIFLFKLLIVFALLLTSVKSWNALKSNIAPKHANYVAVFSIASVAIGEFLNGAARTQNMVVVGDSGIPIKAFVNAMIEVPAELSATILLMLVLSIAFFSAAMFYGIKNLK